MRGLAVTAILAFAAMSAVPAYADDATASAFVEHRLALQLSDADPAKQAMVLSVANNVLKIYGPDKLALEIIAFGPGISLLRTDSPQAARVRSLVAQGVRFDACMNTVTTIERETGKPFPLVAEAHKVEAGVAQLLDLAEHGFTIVRP